mmetsp:Transcript_6958/g.20315  ORF Transcript_6958/g.20315 Transcript_6958/m.20315 type:complete len:231 (-) Transcript_6958:23-715(-)
MTALLTGPPRYASAVSRIFVSVKALIWLGLYCLPPASTQASPLGALLILYDTILASRATSGSSNLRPMSRLTAYTVLLGLVTAWRLAGNPTSLSPLSVKATTDGVVRAPSAFSITRADFPSIIETQELVVPKSIPMTSLPEAAREDAEELRKRKSVPAAESLLVAGVCVSCNKRRPNSVAPLRNMAPRDFDQQQRLLCSYRVLFVTIPDSKEHSPCANALAEASRRSDRQ